MRSSGRCGSEAGHHHRGMTPYLTHPYLIHPHPAGRFHTVPSDTMDPKMLWLYNAVWARVPFVAGSVPVVIKVPTRDDKPVKPQCALCHKVAHFKCGRCRNTNYCSRECQVAHRGTHKLVCHTSSKYRFDRGKKINVGKGIAAVMKALQIHITLFPQTGLSEPGIFELVAHKDDCFWFTMIGWDR